MKYEADKLTQYLPLQQADLHILLALGRGEKHGYAIMQQVAEETNGHVRLGPGTLYGAIKRLHTAGLITESEHRPSRKKDDERRRYYRLASLGRQVLSAELDRLAAVVRIAATAGFVSQHSLGLGGVS
jgi:DNA-binding PadR family transcriptional regulator